MSDKLRLKREGPENVFWAEPSQLRELEKMREFLETASSQRGGASVRICFHASEAASLHQMLILHQVGSYVRPHKHPNSDVVYVSLRGCAEILFFTDDGSLEKIVSLPSLSESLNPPSVMIIPRDQYYMPRVVAGPFLFLEITSGPFLPSSTVFAHWAPERNAIQAQVDEFLSRID